MNKEILKEYKTDGLTIYWRPNICQHAAKCVNGYPEVFKLERRPWIKLEGASLDKVVNIIDTCPSGALSYKRKG
ncbi:MAG: (4Fe-4S)-binding protein [Peptoniphilaceae bacterium]